MKLIIENWRRYINEAVNLICPPATQDLELNTKNRDSAIHAEHIQYGPLNVGVPGDYWQKIAEYWNTTEEAAKASNCGNCTAFATLLVLVELGRRADLLKRIVFQKIGRNART